MTDPRSLCCGLLAVLALAGGARAETPSLAVLNAAVRPALPARDLAPTSPHPGDGGFEPVTMLKSAVERRLGPDGLTGALGLLCGRQPNRDISGGAGAFDKDPEGKFVGAQLRRTF